MTFSAAPSFFIVSVLSFCLAAFTFGATLTQDEVQALEDIAHTMGKKDWNFGVDPCSERSNWVTLDPVKGNENSVTCDCTFVNHTVCHVVSIILKTQNLQGKLPTELTRLPYLQEIDLTRNYLNGTIPKEWGSLNLVNISLLGNRLTGPIPKELANITTLKSLVLEYNQFSGNLPPELGSLAQLERLLLGSNNFTGEIPTTYARLTALKDIRLGDNQFSGKIPDFIQNWTNLTKLVIQGSGMSGPIPSGISFLEKMTDLRISDLNEADSTFPALNNMTKLKTLILRSCNINGTLPEYLGDFTALKTLDLSFNKLTGPIPSSYGGLTNVDYIFFTGNRLNGNVPQWIEKADNLDLSYNNFSSGNTEQPCQRGSTNLFASSSTSNTSGTVSCLRSFRCPRTLYSLHINCGGRQVTVNGSKTYDADSDTAGPARYHQGGTNWAFSTTGYYLDNEHSDYYTWANTTTLSMTNAELYMNARVSPISLTYYGFCLGNGNYTVNLHFAEIMFYNDNTYNSLGRRVFDIYIQGKLVLKDFNIAKEAGGAGKVVTKPFTAVVTANTLEIRLYWAGKGTTGMPFRTVHGPLISAISVESDFAPPVEDGNSSTPVGTVVGIVAAIAGVIILVLVVLWWRGCLGKKSSLARDLKGLDLKTGLFSLRQLKAATNNFDAANKIGEGGFGPVFKGFLSDGTIIAVKQLSAKSKQGNREFINEIGMISALQHPYLVKLYGCCVEGDQLLLVYEYLENNSLARALFGPEECQLKLNWLTRQKICVGIARAKLDEEDNTHISTKIAGTYGYMAPEYAMHGYLTDKADVYSFGIVALEIVSGRANTLHRPKGEAFHLLDWANLLKEKGDLMELVDKRLGSDFDKEEAMVMITVALLCTNVTAAHRPTMSSVVSMLEGSVVVPELVAESSEVLDEKKLESIRQYYEQMEEDRASEIQKHGASMEGPWTASSSSAADLYPLHLDSSYLEKRN
ncbi:hypothetical protein L6164_018305 [Bauhinia variegata]|uniref:Uncharacterized protein n=1 Tax=Bauhinia variegata TaxID=167791 RepID=A0ACB9NE97_BAUVA|nr:hypothetical protein L6164_018305 [Bauhinia variegata]